MSKVWLVSRGYDWEGQDVIGAYSTPEKAQERVDKELREIWRPEEWGPDPERANHWVSGSTYLCIDEWAVE